MNRLNYHSIQGAIVMRRYVDETDKEFRKRMIRTAVLDVIIGAVLLVGSVVGIVTILK